MTAGTTLELLDWKRRVFALYESVRASGDPEAAWRQWRETREELFRTHPQSPLPGYAGLDYLRRWRFDHLPDFVGDLDDL